MHKKILLLVAFFLTYHTLPAQNEEILGDWYGIGDVNGTKLRIVFHIDEDDGRLQATMDSPDQNAFGIKTDTVTFSNNKLTIKVNSILLTYQGELNSQQEIQGKILQRGIFNIPVTLGRKPLEAVIPERPQEPKPPFDYQVEAVNFQNQKVGHSLAGTLTIPDTLGQYPAVVLISGSGPQNRDEEINGHKPFWVIADYLTRRGMAVLRYDDRGIGQSTGSFQEATTFDFANDVSAAVAYLKSRKDIKKQKIGLIGHSEGGMIAPVVAATDKTIDFIVLLAGVGTTGREVYEAQTVLIANAKGIPPAFVQKTSNDIKVIIDAVVNYENPEESAEVISDFINSELDLLPPEHVKSIGGREAKIKENLSIYNNKWMRTFLRFNPADYLVQVKCPVLALNGTLDLQVPYDENLEAIKNALEAGGNKHYKVIPMEGLNHLFQHAKKGLPKEYGNITETFAPEALTIIGDWIREQE
ncbi:alpha/beta fold hydrolase [Fulvivirgaceae bacterium BMA12]|uniref:Alpha/beta fold hydrolase n=1 Tax=Agaribacillus aureus TaxID=3051825 RepID=A0ABT8L0F4_9BACT|nr:alpha/beta fold hydrolase [Fulvivirgaceae bacterium BMA12]